MSQGVLNLQGVFLDEEKNCLIILKNLFSISLVMHPHEMMDVH